MRCIIASLLLLLTLPLQAAQVQVKGVRIWAAPDNTRVVFDLAAPVDHEILHLDNPRRLVVDMEDAQLLRDPAQPAPDDNYLKTLRSAPRDGDDLRVVFDLKKNVTSKTFLLQPNERYGHRLVVDVFPADGDKTIGSPREPAKSVAERSANLRDVIVAIDAGHGGEDPGAIGSRGTQEKEVVMQIARRLADKVNSRSGMRAVLTRDGDYFLPLRRRIEIAREHQADLFISLHADAFRDRRVHGSSVYVLSKRGASSEAARWLAEQENASDKIGGVSLDDKDDVLKAVLLDLSQTGTLEASIDLAENLIDDLAQTGKVHRRDVQSAGFLVLKAPDIPSVLVETAFISNPEEERKLRDRGHQERLATALLNGLHEYFARHAPEGTLLAARDQMKKHVISRGDTLSAIAQQYRVSQDRIKQSNGLKTDKIRVGQVLVIPPGGDS